VSYLAKRKFYYSILLISVIVLLLLGIFSLFVGTANIGFLDVCRILASKLPGIQKLVSTDNIRGSSADIIIKLRLPRAVLVILVGSGLAAVGAAMQSVFRNPMAEPGILGLSSGAGLGATIAIVIGLDKTVLGLSAAAASAFIGAIATVFIVYNISRTGHRISPTVLILAGTAISFMNSAVIQLIMIFRRDRMDYIIMWTMGSFSSPSWNKIAVLLPFLLPGLAVILFHARDLNIISTGVETAKTLGVEVERTKKFVLASCSIVTAACVATSGIIGFVGLIIPHLLRLLVGTDQRVLLPFSIVGGAAFLLVCDTLARVAAPPAEIPVGAITAVFGSPFFIALLIKVKRSVM